VREGRRGAGGGHGNPDRNSCQGGYFGTPAQAAIWQALARFVILTNGWQARFHGVSGRATLKALGFVPIWRGDVPRARGPPRGAPGLWLAFLFALSLTRSSLNRSFLEAQGTPWEPSSGASRYEPSPLSKTAQAALEAYSEARERK
jgi:hypothetical protein